MDKEWAAGSFTIQVRNGLQDCLQFECTPAPQWSVNIQLVQLTCQKFYPTWPGNVSKSCRLRYSNMDIKSSFVEWMRNGPQDRLPLPHRDDPSLISFVFQLLILSYGAYRIAYRLCMYYIPSRHYLGMFVANASKKSSNECMYIVTSRH